MKTSTIWYTKSYEELSHTSATISWYAKSDKNYVVNIELIKDNKVRLDIKEYGKDVNTRYLGFDYENNGTVVATEVVPLGFRCCD